MGFLSLFKKEKVPDQLPSLLMENHDSDSKGEPSLAPRVSLPDVPKPIVTPSTSPNPHKSQASEEKSLTFDIPDQLDLEEADKASVDIKEQITEAHGKDVDSKENFFNGILEDINGEIKDLGKLDEWYHEKFLPKDVISDMKGYWEGNKSELILKSFGKEYKEKIHKKIDTLQGLETEWRKIYFELIKKEEDMKKEERELKELLSDLVSLCKKRSEQDEKEKKSSVKKSKT